MNQELIDPRDMTIGQLKDFFISRGYTSYRASQLFSFLHKFRKRDFEELTNFSKDFRKKCNDWFYFRKIEPAEIKISKDTTKKILFMLDDKNFIESVLLSNNDRYTACISSQVGCRFGCKFCRTSEMGFRRNLLPSEIVEQFGYLNSYLFETEKKRISNLVFMGMGEPLDNYDNVLSSVEILSQSGGYELSRNRMTVSTCGHIEAIEKLIQDKRSPQLAISLNSADQSKRELIMPCAKKWHIEPLINIAVEFSLKKKERVTLEYIMIRDFNDSLSDADNLLRIITRKSCFKVNIIPCNSGKDSKYQPSPAERITAFQKHLKANRLSAHLRQTRGDDILAACGQLAYLQDHGIIKKKALL